MIVNFLNSFTKLDPHIQEIRGFMGILKERLFKKKTERGVYFQNTTPLGAGIGGRMIFDYFGEEKNYK